MSTSLKVFFKGLSERMYKENDLSDITYALCLANLSFRQFFLDFFFRGKFRLKRGCDVEFTREWNDGDNNRPDFKIEDRRLGKYYIEVKKWDRNQHFEPYLQSIKVQHRKDYGASMSDEDAARHIGYISAYRITQIEYPQCVNFEVRTWSELYEDLKAYDFLGDDSIRAYGEYLQIVCGIQGDLDSYRFRLDDFKNVKEFLKALNEAVKNSGNKIYSRRSGFIRNCRAGTFFEISNYYGSPVWGWVGAYFSDSKVEVVVDFEDKVGWGRAVCDKFGRAPCEDGKTIWYYASEGGHLYFYMTDKDGGDVKKFLERVLQEIQEPYKAELAMPRERSTQTIAQQFGYMLAMRKFPSIMEREDFSVDGFELEWSSRDDSEVQGQHCGRYFTVNTSGASSRHSWDGWAGVLYSERKPKFVIQIKGVSGYETQCEIKEQPDMKAIVAEFKERLKEFISNRM